MLFLYCAPTKPEIALLFVPGLKFLNLLILLLWEQEWTAS